VGAADPVVSAVLLGFGLGIQHATDPDHLVAVATIVTGESRLRRGALIGLLWRSPRRSARSLSASSTA
jgi:ABC-type nickel/cobalt efflux system permease component RcnA